MEVDSGCVYQELSSANGKSFRRSIDTPRDFSVTKAPGVFVQRDLHLARDAFERGDIEASKSAHMPGRREGTSTERKCHVERHTNASSDYLKALVFGGLDGIVTLFAIVAGCVGAHLTPMQTVVVGIGNLLADAVSMGFGEYVSASTESDFMESEKLREIWEVENYPEGEKCEMIEIYENKYNFTHEDAQTMVNIAFKYKDFYISHMMAEELGIIVDDQSPSPARRGGVMFAAFNIFGLIPLAGFSFWCFVYPSLPQAGNFEHREMNGFWVASILSCITLYILGAIKASFINQSAIKSGFQMMANGAAAGAVAFGVGVVLQNTIGSSPVT